MKKILFVALPLLLLISCGPKESWTKIVSANQAPGMTFYLDQNATKNNSDGSKTATAKIVFDQPIVIPTDPSGKEATQLLLVQTYKCDNTFSVDTSVVTYKDGTTYSESGSIAAPIEEGSPGSVIQDIVCKK